MNLYTIRWRHCWRWAFWQTIKNVSGHRYDPQQNKLIVYFPDGTLREIGNWSTCEVKLGLDWLAATHKEVEKEAGQKVTLAVGG